MRVLMLTCDNRLQDGMNRHLLALAPALNALPACTVAVCTTYPAGEFNAALERVGVQTYALGLPHGHSLRTWPRFARVLRDFRPDLVHAHAMGWMERLYLGICRPRLPIVATHHGLSDFETGVRRPTFKSRLEAVLRHLLPGKARETIYISRGVARAKGHPDGTVVYNPVAFEERVETSHVLRAELHLPPETPIVGTACRMTPTKRPKVFVEVMCRVLQAVPSAHAVVCGTANEAALMDGLRRAVAEAGVSDRFHWLGYRADAPQLTRELDCFVMTSATEGLPTALLEAMAARTPIAFLRGRGGLEDLDELDRAEGPIASVADPDDAAGLARQIVASLRQPAAARARAERAFTVGRRHFDLASVRGQIAAVYRRLLNDGVSA